MYKKQPFRRIYAAAIVYMYSVAMVYVNIPCSYVHVLVITESTHIHCQLIVAMFTFIECSWKIH